MCWHKPADGATCDVFTRNTDALNTPPLPSPPPLWQPQPVFFSEDTKIDIWPFIINGLGNKCVVSKNQRAAFLAGGLKYTLPDSSTAATPFAYIKQRNKVVWTSHNVPNTFRAPSSYIRAWACEKTHRSDVLHSVWVTLLSVCSRLVGICEGVHISVCVCALASSHVLLCVC